MNFEATNDLAERKHRIINNLLNVTNVGNVYVIFHLNDPASDSGTLEITKGEKVIVKGIFYVFAEDSELFTALYSANNESSLQTIRRFLEYP